MSGVDSVKLNVVPSRIVGSLSGQLLTAPIISWGSGLVYPSGCDSVRIFDTLNGTDSSLSTYTMNTHVFGCASVFSDGKLYIMGESYPNQGNYDTSMTIYDLTSNTWSEGPSIPVNDNYALAAANGQVYMLGQGNGLTVLPTIREFDPNSGTWTRKADCPSNLFSNAPNAVCENGNKVYVIFGGVHIQGEEYDPSTDSWSSLPSISISPIFDFSVAWLDDKLYIVGGVDPTFQLAYNVVEEYNPISNQWNQKPSLLISRASATTIGLGNRLFVLGGFDEREPSPGSWFSEPVLSVESYKP